ncbi:hypothetical protein ONE63_010141 [Megalurothrips usitatus]|uniref:Thyroid adenoma-associated protein homolog n=1 Tax=Megalurothrips usitatus TaxID=439358 RepID=A0AAV7XKD4_9NEOP|nr:hypothetical protein ONE63_010141 [Megalurothrips usitatus]
MVLVSVSRMSFDGAGGDGSLQENLKTLLKWCDKDVEVDSSKRAFIQFFTTQLDEIENHGCKALLWAHGSMLVAQLTQRKQDEEIIEKSLSILTSTIETMKSADLLKYVLKIGKLFITTKYLPSTPCAASSFLKKCFSTLNKELAQDFSRTLQELVSECAVFYISVLVEDLSHKAVLHTILFTLFSQLINPACDKSKNVVKHIFSTCDWKVNNTIREMLNDALLSGKVHMNELSSLSFRGHVYQVIFELLVIKKDLVVGLINNTELCLADGREDCLEGLDFFCKMFGTEVPGELNPCEFFSHLWHEFLSHCRNNSLVQTRELLVLAQHTPHMLSHSSTRGNWCELLFHFFEYKMPFECEKNFILSITSSLQDSQLWSDDESPCSLLSLVERLLSPESPIERYGKSRSLLLKDLGCAYKNAAKAGMNDLELQNVHNFCSKLLSCLLGTCSSLLPSNKDWAQLRKLFVHHLVPYDENDEVRMKMMLYLWLNCDSKQFIILHELFSKSKCVRTKLKSILPILEDEEAARSKRHLLPKLFRELHLASVQEVVFGTFLLKIFFPVLRKNLQFQRNLKQVLSEASSCSENNKLVINLKETLWCPNGVDRGVVEGFLFYVGEVQFDQASMKQLIKLVKQCLEGHEISKHLGRHHLNVARTALHLLNEILYITPYLGFNTELLEYIFDWSRPSNGTLSILALQCLTSLSSHQKLGDYSHEFMGRVLLLCLSIIDDEPRGQVKMAIKCLAAHLSVHSDRDIVLRDVLTIVQRNLNNPIGPIDIERGVSALGHFSAICPSSLKQSVESDCLSKLICIIREARDEQQSDILSSCSSNNTWIDWKELSHNVSVQVQALRSIGRCMRFCGSLHGVKEALETLELLLLAPKDSFGNYREVEIDHLRSEAALAILFIFEAERFHSLISRSLLISLSKMLMDPRIEVRHRFAEKLCQGLSPYKVRSYINGRSRCNLPPCFLGLLVLLGSDLWMNNQVEKERATLMLREVCVSRHVSVVQNSFFKKVAVKKFYEKEPLSVLENILAIAVPILVENSVFDLDSFLEDTGDIDVLTSITQCLKFICSSITHSSTYGGKVTKEYMKRLVDAAKQNLYPCSGVNQLKKYSIVFELLSLVVKHYNTSVTNQISPPIALPLPFFTHEIQQNFVEGQNNFNLTVSCLNRVEKIVYYSKNVDEQQADKSLAETSFNLSHSDLSMESEPCW